MKLSFSSIPFLSIASRSCRNFSIICEIIVAFASLLVVVEDEEEDEEEEEEAVGSVAIGASTGGGGTSVTATKA